MYDRFKLYPIVDPGRWEFEDRGTSFLFHHTLEGYYAYTKEIRTVSERSFAISHELKVQIPWDGTVYNHNFFTMGKMETGPSRMIDFPFRPAGTWRTAYDSVLFTEGGIRFTRKLREGESVYAGDIHQAGETGMPYVFTLREGPLSVHVRGDIPVTHTVLWANHRIACVEPYNRLRALPGETLRWTILYQFNLSERTFKQVQDTQTTGTFTPRHGTVIAITKDELELLQAWDALMQANQELRSRTTPTFTLEQLDGRKALLDKTQQVLKGKASAKAYKAQAKIIQKFLK